METVPLPTFLQIEPVGQCNLGCQMCPIQFRHDGPGHGAAFMAYDEFTQLIDQFIGVRELHLQGLVWCQRPPLCPGCCESPHSKTTACILDCTLIGCLLNRRKWLSYRFTHDFCSPP